MAQTANERGRRRQIWAGVIVLLGSLLTIAATLNDIY